MRFIRKRFEFCFGFVETFQKFWIENGTHTWENGTYTMSLELAFKYVLDMQEEDEEDQEYLKLNSVLMILYTISFSLHYSFSLQK